MEIQLLSYPNGIYSPSLENIIEKINEIIEHINEGDKKSKKKQKK
jgi:hypothetical protein